MLVAGTTRAAVDEGRGDCKWIMGVVMSDVVLHVQYPGRVSRLCLPAPPLIIPFHLPNISTR